MAIDTFLKLGDLKGESIVKGFEDQIQLMSWSWGMTQTGTTHAGSGAGAGKVNVADLTITKYVDTSSPNLIQACCTGKHFETAVITMRRAGGTSPLDYVKISLNDIIITSVNVGGSGGEDLLSENVSLNFAKFKYEYQPQDNKGGKKGGTITAGYNIAANIPS